MKERHRLQLLCQQLEQQIRVATVRHQFENSSRGIEKRMLDQYCDDFSIDWDTSSPKEERRWAMEGLSDPPVGMSRAEVEDEMIIDTPPFSTSPPPLFSDPEDEDGDDECSDEDYVEIIGETERTIDGIRYIIVLE